MTSDGQTLYSGKVRRAYVRYTPYGLVEHQSLAYYATCLLSYYDRGVKTFNLEEAAHYDKLTELLCAEVPTLMGFVSGTLPEDAEEDWDALGFYSIEVELVGTPNGWHWKVK